MAAMRVPRGAVAALVMLAALLAACASEPASLGADISSRAAVLSASRQLLGYRPIPIDSSIVLLFMSDVEGDNSPCMQMVTRALSFRGRAINFFVTGYYTDNNGDNRVDALGYKESQWDKSFRPYTWDAAYRFSRGLTRCMRYAVDQGMAIVTHIHLDDGNDAGTWRNSMRFSPTTKYGAMSYFEAVLKPTADAVKEANYRRRTVYFSLQAEMGATLFFHPVSWRNTIGQVKNIISKTGTPRNKVKVGININWEKVCGCPAELTHSSNYYNELKSNWWRVQGEINIPAVQRLFQGVDWIGVSAYAGMPRYPTLADLEVSLQKVDQELALFGLNLKGLGKEIVFSEYGIGGGMTGDYTTPAPNAAVVASSPYWGVGGMYSTAKDPWRIGENRDFMHNFYRLTVEYARRGGVNYPVSAMYLWNIISYDVQGIHYFSYSNQGSYRDDTVAGILTAHNNAVRQ